MGGISGRRIVGCDRSPDSSTVIACDGIANSIDNPGGAELLVTRGVASRRWRRVTQRVQRTGLVIRCTGLTGFAYCD